MVQMALSQGKQARQRPRGLGGFDFSDLGFVFGALCCFSLTLIQPWGEPRADVWTDPKVYSLIALTCLCYATLAGDAFFRWRYKEGERLSVPRGWPLAAILWAALLAWGYYSARSSPVNFKNAIVAHVEMGDGWLYWVWVGAFVLGNALLLRRFPEFFKPQLYGFLFAGLLMVVAVGAQSVDWRLDFTRTMGQEVSTPNPDVQNRLLSNIYQGQMPIGLTSHRGHAAFVVAALGVLCLLAMVRGWLRPRLGWPLYALLLAGIFLTATRGAQIAFVAGLIYLSVRFWREKSLRRSLALAWTPLLAGILAVGVAVLLGVPSVTRNMPSMEVLQKRVNTNSDARTINWNKVIGILTSDRSNYWPVAVKGIEMRPLRGWGYNGFGLAFGYANDFNNRYKMNLAQTNDKKAIPIEKIVGTDHYYFRYLGTDGARHLGALISNKSHNLFLDLTLSQGLVGLALYLALFVLFIVATVRGAGRGLEAVAVVYLVYGLTWFEMAQFSHLTWWALSAGLALCALPQDKLARLAGASSAPAEPVP